MMSEHHSILRQPDEFADLHIFVVPEDLWLEKYRTAFNNIALESVSAGFVRVQPYVSLKYLRDHIEEQLGPEVVPEDYVFLRSVGRCMAVVKENQERLLKAKDFLPPVSFTPEIFILPGTHDSLAKPVENAANTVIQTNGLTTAGLASIQQPHQFPGISGGFMQYPQALPKVPTQKYNSIQQTGERRDVEDLSKTNRFNEVTYENEDDSHKERDLEAYGGHWTSENRSSGSRQEGDKILSDERQENLKYIEAFNAEHEVTSDAKKNKINKKGSNSSSESNQSESKMVKFIQPEVYQSLPFAGGVISPATPIPSGRVIASPFPAQQVDQEYVTHEGEGHIYQQKRRQKASKKKRRDRSRSPSLERKPFNELPNPVQGEDQGILNEQVENGDSSTVYGEVTVSLAESPPTLSEVHERSKVVQFPSPLRGERQPSDFPDDQGFGYEKPLTSGLDDLDDKLGGDQNLKHVDFDNQKEKDSLNFNKTMTSENAGHEGNTKDTTAEDEKTGTSSEDAKEKYGVKNNDAEGTGTKIIKKTVKKQVVKKPTENLEDRYRLPEMPKVSNTHPVKQHKQKEKGLEQETASAKDMKQLEIEKLRADLRKAKNARVDMEKEREGKVRRAKMLQNQMMQKRNQSKNIWKKRFFDEKRKTGALDEQVNRLRHDVDVQHKALMAHLESKEREGNKPAAGSDYRSPSEKTNQRMSLARLQHEVEELKRRIEELKMKLTVEMKNRDAAQKELKQIREELMEKKINLTLTKSQKSLTTLTNTENIAV